MIREVARRPARDGRLYSQRMPEPVVTVERDGDVLLIGVDRAAKRNAWNLQVIREVAQAYGELAD